MKKKTEKFCGNCSHHSPYNYPDQMFCTKRFFKNKNPIVSTSWYCEDWTPSVQGCYCLEEARSRHQSR